MKVTSKDPKKLKAGSVFPYTLSRRRQLGNSQVSVRTYVPSQLSTGQWIGVLLVGALAIGLTGCDRSPPEQSKGGLPSSADEAILTYGYAPIPNSSVTYQPDVIFIEGGPYSIRSASADGLVWTMDGHAKGVKDLRSGSIMFATGRAVGRVVRLEQLGEDVAVTVEPVNLGEILRDAHIDLDLTLSPQDFTYQLIPDLPGRYTNLEATTPTGPRVSAFAHYNDPVTLEFPEISIANAAPPIIGPSAMPYARKDSFKVQVGHVEVEPSIKEALKDGKARQRIGLKILWKFQPNFLPKEFEFNGMQGKSGLKVGIEAVLWMSNLHLHSTLTYKQGRFFSKDFSVDFGDFDGMDVSIISGAENGLTDNQKIHIEVPVELISHIPPSPSTYGIPFVTQLKFKFIFQTVHANKNSTVGTAGSFKMVGSVGYANGKMITPVVTETESLAKAVTGISLAPNGFVFALEFRAVPLGLGIPAGFAGPYVKLIPTVDLTKGSDIGFLRCSIVNGKVDAGVGLGVQVSSKAKPFLEKILGKKGGFELEYGDFYQTLFKNSWYYPDSKFCRR